MDQLSSLVVLKTTGQPTTVDVNTVKVVIVLHTTTMEIGILLFYFTLLIDFLNSDEDELVKGSCEWQDPPEHGFNFRPCSKGLCSDIAGSPKSHCATRFTRCDPGYVLIGGSGNDTCINGQWSCKGHQCIRKLSWTNVISTY